MKIYTKTGDKGFTDISGSRVKKSSALIGAIGAIDALVMNLGYSKLDGYNVESVQDDLYLIMGYLSGYSAAPDVHFPAHLFFYNKECFDIIDRLDYPFPESIAQYFAAFKKAVVPTVSEYLNLYIIKNSTVVCELLGYKEDKTLLDCFRDLVSYLHSYPIDPAPIEEMIDGLNNQLPPLTKFIKPGGNAAEMLFHNMRINVRDLERQLIAQDAMEHAPFINRLSDLLFVMARYALHLDSIDEPLFGCV
jgi:cob(I)alamin adenosyltransferase